MSTPLISFLCALYFPYVLTTSPHPALNGLSICICATLIYEFGVSIVLMRWSTGYTNAQLAERCVGCLTCLALTALLTDIFVGPLPPLRAPFHLSDGIDGTDGGIDGIDGIRGSGARADMHDMHDVQEMKDMQDLLLLSLTPHAFAMSIVLYLYGAVGILLLNRDSPNADDCMIVAVMTGQLLIAYACDELLLAAPGSLRPKLAAIAAASFSACHWID